MIAYVDSSVLIRVQLNQKNKLKKFGSISRAISSKLIRYETLRTFDRLRVLNQLDQDNYINAVEDFQNVIGAFELVEISEPVLDRVSGSYPVPIGTLDAIHLASAQVWRDHNQSLVFLTHDKTLEKAASVAGFEVLG
jgi:predicted nucleic acid-binding protein